MKKVRLHCEGVGLFASFLLILMLICWVTLAFVSFKGVLILTLLAPLTMMGLALNFFRFPRRDNSEVTNRRLIAVLADGKVMVMEKVEEPELLGRHCLKLSIFMSLYNVHANWVARNDTITHAEHQSGAYYKVLLPKSSMPNERSAVIIRADGSYEVLERQIARAVARCIVTCPKAGDRVTVEDLPGFIKSGSRIDLYLPLGTEIAIKIGDKVVDGETTLGYLPQQARSLLYGD